MAYTKYSLTPANNTATPPDGAPEGMLPSAVNDTMRDMMAQIRDVGDGIRGGTYTMTAPVITGGSINNTPIGASTANTGAFTTLSASGAFSANGGATLGDASGDALTINSSAVSIPNGLNFDSNTFVIDATNDRVGIGTSSPSSKLEVSNSANSATVITVRNANGGASASARISFINSATVGEIGQTSTTYGGYGVLTADATYMYAGNNRPIQFATDNNYIAFGTGSGALERMRIDSSGNVGIGMTPSGDSRLEVYSADSATIYKNVNTGTGTSDGFYVGMGKSSATEAYVYNRENNNIIFGTNNAERMRITSGGNVGINLSNPGNRFAVEQGIEATATGFISNNRNISGDYALTLALGSNCNDTSSVMLHCTQPGVRNVAFIYGNGNLANQNNSYGSSSDIKLKENIVDATPKLADLCKVRIRNYNLKSDPDHKQIGVIAQELETVFPGLIDETPDLDTEGNKLETTTKSVKYSVFVPMLIKAIQEQQAMIEELKQEVAALKAK